MAQKYTIYINQNSLLITEQATEAIKKLQPLDAENFDGIQFYKSLKKQQNEHFYLLVKDAKAFFKMLKKQFTIVKAAGGLVKNSKAGFLFIYRNKKWDLPKGKVEKGEKVKVTAVREVEEECGVVVESRGDLLCKTYHIYEMNGKTILKRTSWYEMKVRGNPDLIPQTEEGITKAEWVTKAGIKTKIKNTYPLILDVLQAQELI
jgi:8-oxo-dGTP pyrophosphatase MutT (NUDIX family)